MSGHGAGDAVVGEGRDQKEIKHDGDRGVGDRPQDAGEVSPLG